MFYIPALQVHTWTSYSKWIRFNDLSWCIMSTLCSILWLTRQIQICFLIKGVCQIIAKDHYSQSSDYGLQIMKFRFSRYSSWARPLPLRSNGDNRFSQQNTWSVEKPLYWIIELLRDFNEQIGHSVAPSQTVECSSMKSILKTPVVVALDAYELLVQIMCMICTAYIKREEQQISPE